MVNEGARPRTSHSISTLNRFFSLQESQSRLSTTAPSGFDSASGLHLLNNHTSENLTATTSEYRHNNSENIFKRTFDMVERVAKKERKAVRSYASDLRLPSMSSVTRNASQSTGHGLQRRESVSSSSGGGSIRTARRLFNQFRRRGAVSGASGQTFSQAQRMTRHSEEVLRTHWTSFPSQTFSPGSGSAAKAAAQQANLDRQHFLSMKQKQLRADSPEDLMDVDSAYEAENDRYYNTDMGQRLDPLMFFPTEVAMLVFNYLGQETLRSATQVSQKWHHLAESPAVWRTSFLSTYKRRPNNPAPYVQMGGLGLGEPNKADQPWKEMSKARQALERAWKKSSPKAIYFNGHTDSVYCCQFDEKKLITGSRDRTIRVWDMATYECIKVIGGPTSKPTAQGQQILDVAPTTYRNYPSVNGTPKGDAIFHIPADYHSASILCLQYDDEIMVTGSSDNSCIIWDINTFEPIKRLRKHTAGVLDVCIDNTYIISCSKDATICVWDRKTLTLIKQLEGHKGPVNAVQLRGNLLVSASGDGKSKLWDMETLSHVRDYESRDRGLAAVEFSDDARYVLAGGNDQVIYKYDAQSADLLHTMKGHGGLVRSLFLDYSNKRVLSGSYDQGIRIYDFESGDQLAVYDNWTTSWILAAKSDYRRIVATSQDGRALLMDFGIDVPGADVLSSLRRAEAARGFDGKKKARSMSCLKREDSAGPVREGEVAKRARVFSGGGGGVHPFHTYGFGVVATPEGSYASVAREGHRLSLMFGGSANASSGGASANGAADSREGSGNGFGTW